MRSLKHSFVVMLLFALSGCAMISTTPTIQFDSDPKNAKVYYDGELIGKTPTKINIQENMSTLGKHTIVIKKGGYQTWEKKFQDKMELFIPRYDYPRSVYADLKQSPNYKQTSKSAKYSKPSDTKSTAIDTNKFEKLKDKKNFISNWRAPEETRLVSIGVTDFEDSSISKVKYADKDAQYITSSLKSSGIPKENITCLTNKEATRGDILEALSKLKMATTKKSETAIFYFSGHGAPILEDGEIVDAALIPYDTTPTNIKYSGIRLSNLKNMLSGTQGNWIVILDACFSGKEGRSFMAKDVKSIAVVPNDYNVAPKDSSRFYWLTSTSGDNFANSFPKQEHGLFTYYFVKALNGERGVDKNEDGLITLEEAFDWTEDKVASVSKKSLGRPQYPEMTGQGNMILTMPQ